MEQEHNVDFSALSLYCLLRWLLRNLWMILASAAICACAVSMYLDYFHTPQYASTETYVVTSRNIVSSSRNISSAKELTALVTQMLDSTFVNDAISSYSPELSDYRGGITASQVPSSNFIVVESVSTSPKKALLALIALEEYMPSLLEYLSYNAVVQPISLPSVSQTPTNQIDVRHYLLFASAAGAAIMIVLLLSIRILQETVQTREGAKRLLASPVLASIGHERTRMSLLQRLRIRKYVNPLLITSPLISPDFIEQINSIAARLEYERIEKNRRIILITSTSVNEGKSTIAANLALSLSRNGHGVALIDADLRNPSLAPALNVHRRSKTSYADILSGEASMKKLPACVLRKGTLSVLCAYEPSKNASELLSSPNFQNILRYFDNQDYILIDTPPIGMFADAEILAGAADESLLVVRQDYVPARDINDVIDMLRQGRSAFLGCILNDMNSLGRYLPMAYGYGYGRYGKYGYSARYGGYGYGRNQQRNADSSLHTKG